MILRSPDLVLEYDRRKQYEEVKEGLKNAKLHKERFVTQCDDETLTIRIWRRKKNLYHSYSWSDRVAHVTSLNYMEECE